jgi:hypothetical protein
MCATAYKQTLKFEVYDFVRLNLYVKSLPNFMHNYDEQLCHATPHKKNSICCMHILLRVCLPSIRKTHIPESSYQCLRFTVKMSTVR